MSEDKSLVQSTTEEWEIIIFQVRSERGHIYVVFLRPTDWMADKGKSRGQGECVSSESVGVSTSSC